MNSAAFNLLRALVNETTVQKKIGAVFNGSNQVGQTALLVAFLSDLGCGVDLDGGAAVITLKASRAVHPACVVVSRSCGQFGSPSAQIIERRGNYFLQVFEGGANDGLEDSGAQSQNWLNHKGRVLFY